MAKRFDLTTHVRGKDGRIKHVQPYRLHVNGGEKLFERPPGSGIFYYESGQMTSDSQAKLAADAQKGEAKAVGALAAFGDQEKVEEDKALDQELDQLFEEEAKPKKRK